MSSMLADSINTSGPNWAVSWLAISPSKVPPTSRSPLTAARADADKAAEGPRDHCVAFHHLG